MDLGRASLPTVAQASGSRKARPRTRRRDATLDEQRAAQLEGLHHLEIGPEKPAYTMVAGGGGGSMGYHYSEPRSLTNRERARLQTFSDDFIFEGSTREVRSQVGNAVPPEGARQLVSTVVDALRAGGVEPSRSQRPARRSRRRKARAPIAP
jgi:site-specific DNA-cytosine methylase